MTNESNGSVNDETTWCARCQQGDHSGHRTDSPACDNDNQFNADCRCPAGAKEGLGVGEGFPRVNGECPMGCGHTLFLGSRGYVTCSWLSCPDPLAADHLLHPSPIPDQVLTPLSAAWSDAEQGALDQLIEALSALEPSLGLKAILNDAAWGGFETFRMAIRAPLEARIEAAERVITSGGAAEYRVALDAWRALLPAAALAGVPPKADDEIERLRRVNAHLMDACLQRAEERDGFEGALRALTDAINRWPSSALNPTLADALMRAENVLDGLAGVPKEATCETCGGEEDDRFHGWHAHPDARFHPFKPAVVAAPVEDAK